MSNSWSAWTDFEEVKRRAGGRRHYNSVRQFRALMRRREVARLLLEGLSQAQIARRLGVNRSTICRDFWALMEEARRAKRCPICGHEVLGIYPPMI